jgi:type II secretory pathway pseudopilin PulG
VAKRLHLTVRMAFEESTRERGFSLIETLIAIGLLIVVAGSLAQLFAIGQRSNARARDFSMSSILAAAKVEQIRSLSWGFDLAGQPLTDRSADLSVSPERPTGGVGLHTSPSDALDRNVDGYCDFLDASGVPLGTGSSPPLNTSYIRRWSVVPVAADPVNGLVIQVRVVGRSAAETRAGRPAAGEARLVSIRARTAS